jgi:hypothetical protein
MMSSQRLMPYVSNPAYWQYKGQPVLLLGASDEDNLFQMPLSADKADGGVRPCDSIEHDPERMNLTWQLDALGEAGGNFVRCTMSSRDFGDVQPYARSGAGAYNLEVFDEEYWRRFDRFLRLTGERGIIVQVEIWATYDFYQRQARPGYYPWLHNAFNPRNNINYSSEDSGLPEHFPSNGCGFINPFFRAVPALDGNTLLLRFQRSYVDRLLSIAFAYDHVLYCMDNETNAHPEWGAYWAGYVRGKAAEAGVEVETTEMWDSFDPTGGAVEGALRQNIGTNPYVVRSTPLNTLAASDLYTFCDISNHNAQRGEVHYRTGHWFWKKVQESGHVRPVHCDKMYGGDSGLDFAGTRRDGIERFWRNIFAGLAGCRFHRPPAGLGLDADARVHIRGMRMLTNELDIFTCRPAGELLRTQAENIAYCLADPGRAYAVAFLNPGACELDVSAMNGADLAVRWLDIRQGAWRDPEPAGAGASLKLQPPSEGYWATLVCAKR